MRACLVSIFLVLLLMLDVRILVHLHRSSRLNPHRLAIGLVSWPTAVGFVSIVAIDPFSVSWVLFGTLLTLVGFAIVYPLARLVSKPIFETISKSD